jgi:hypothetical protein
VVDVDHHHHHPLGGLALPNHVLVSEAARRLHCRPRDISDLFYQRRLSDERCPIVGGRRMIPTDYLAVIAEALRQRIPKETPARGKKVDQ